MKPWADAYPGRARREGAAGLRALDLFAGAGGLSCGLEWAGHHVVGAIEFDRSACDTFAYNHPTARVWCEDIRTLDPRDVGMELGDIDIVVGGPMCQGVSQRGPRDPKDPRNFAFWAFMDFVRVLRPQFFVMENVPALVSDVHNRALAVAVFSELESLGYHIGAEVLNAGWFGVPQLRYRLLVIGSRVGPVAFSPRVEQCVAGNVLEAEFTSVEEAIGDLPAIPAGGGAEAMRLPVAGDISAYARRLRGSVRTLHNHWSADTDEINLRRIAHVPEGGYWQDIPLDELPPRFRHVRPSDHTTTYRRLHRSHPAFTITTECGNVTSGAFTHPVQNRAISVREAARLQSFPDAFRFLGPKNSQYRQVGNAVPPLLSKHVFDTLMDPPPQRAFTGRIDAVVLRQHLHSRLPFTLAPRYKALFGQSTWAVRRRAGLAAHSAELARVARSVSREGGRRA
jgi:DNA (cytosine-5)-methyltransferase 1